MKDCITVSFIFIFHNHTPDFLRYDRTERLWLSARREDV